MAAVYDPKAYTKPWDAHVTSKRATDATMTETIYAISDEGGFRQRLLNEKPPIPVQSLTLGLKLSPLKLRFP